MIGASLLFYCDYFSSKEFETFAVKSHCKVEALRRTANIVKH